MAESNGHATIKVDDAQIKERMRDLLARAWEDGFHEGRANVSHTRPGECDGRLWYEEDWVNPYRTPDAN